MNALGILLALAVVIERLTEYLFGQVFDRIPKLQPLKWTLMYISAALGIFAAFQFQLDILSFVGLEISPLGMIMTGIAVGGGSNLLHDIIGGIGGNGS